MVNQKKKKTPPARPAVAASNAMKEDAFSAPEAAVTTPSSEIRIEVSDSHPLKEGSSLVVRYRDGSPRLAKVLEAKAARNGSLESFQYYVHYNDFNRRMDEWIDCGRIIKYPSELAEVPVELLLPAEPASDGQQPRPTTIKEDDHDEHEGMDEAALLEHELVTRVKNIKNVSLGKHIMECWYFSPYPEEIWESGPVERLYVCEFTFRYFLTREELVRHMLKPNLHRHPPGHEIYRDANVSMFEVDGASERLYSHGLCYFAKLFLDHKTLYWDVEPFLFYVLCTHDDKGYHPVGFFSKEKYSDLGYNLACILAFPFAQRKSYGKFLIKFSYELSKKEQKLGSPEKPLSDLGAVSYKSYWATELLLALKGYTGSAISIADLCYMTSMLPEDVVPTLKTLKLLVEEENNPGEFVIEAPTEYLDKLLEKYAPKSVYIDLSRLQWIPLYVVDPSIDRWSIQYFKTRGAALCQPSGHNAAVGMAIQGPNGVSAANAMETLLQEEGRLSVSLEEEAMGEDTFSLLEGDEGSSSSSHDDDMVMSFDEEEDPIF